MLGLVFSHCLSSQHGWAGLGSVPAVRVALFQGLVELSPTTTCTCTLSEGWYGGWAWVSCLLFSAE